VNADKAVRLDIANSLWMRSGVKLQRQFAADCDKYYNAPVTALDFGSPDAVPTINDWVAENTNGRIKKIVTELTPEEILVLVNAIYFKGSWTKAFDPKLTSAREFFLPSGGAQRLMMNREDKFRYKADGLMQAVALPYGDERLNLYVFLPRERRGLGQLFFISLLSSPSSLFSGFVEKKGTVILPRFKIEFEQDLNEALIRLGMGQAFKWGADFSGIVAPPDTAFISRVLHKAYIEVNEQGTEAAAATAVTKDGGVLSPEEEFSFVCDHPFLCAIRDDVTGSILFLGAICDPKQ